MSADNYWKRLYISPGMIVLNSFYYFFGRFTGVFIYFFPALFILILFIFQKKTMEDWIILSSIILSILFFIIVTSDNYFGGSGSVGNRYFMSLFPFFFFLGFKNRIFKYSLLPVFISVFFLSGVYTDSFHHSRSQRVAGLSFPIKLFPPEKTQYQCLPTNENPRAFGRVVRDGAKKFQVYFLNDNYWKIEKEDFFWTWPNPDNDLELFLTSPEKVKEFKVALENIPVKNRVCFQIEHKKKKINMKPSQSHILRFSKIEGFKIHDKYLYYIRIKSRESYCPHFEDPYNDDKRVLGVKTHISLVY